jgi:hypothetical protein
MVVFAVGAAMAVADLKKLGVDRLLATDTRFIRKASVRIDVDLPPPTSE